MQRALITGATGQIAAYLAQHLLSKGLQVYMTTRSSSTVDNRFWRLEKLGIKDQVTINQADLESYDSVCYAIHPINPDYVFHLAAISWVADSFKDEFACIQSNFLITHRLLNICFNHNKNCRFIFLGSSEQFGNATESPQDENTPFHPRNPYGIAKAASFELVKYYRNNHKVFACSAICYNQESPLRDPIFVTRKIARGAVRAALYGEQLMLGAIASERDWSHAKDCVEALWLMAEHSFADDYILSSGIRRSVLAFIQQAFIEINKIIPQLKPVYYRDFLMFDKQNARPLESTPLVGNRKKAWDTLGWAPKLGFSELVKEMVQSEWKDLSSHDQG